MTNIEKLIYIVNEKNIRLEPQLGKYSIDIDYIESGVVYFLFRNSEQIAIIAKHIIEKQIQVYYEHIITQKEKDNIKKAVEYIAKNLYKTHYINKK